MPAGKSTKSKDEIKAERKKFVEAKKRERQIRALATRIKSQHRHIEQATAAIPRHMESIKKAERRRAKAAKTLEELEQLHGSEFFALALDEAKLASQREVEAKEACLRRDREDELLEPFFRQKLREVRVDHPTLHPSHVELTEEERAYALNALRAMGMY